VPCKRRYRIAKRIRDHNKKTRKEGKKSGNNISLILVLIKTFLFQFDSIFFHLNFKEKKLKSIQVPNKCPFKDDVLALAEKQKQSVSSVFTFVLICLVINFILFVKIKGP